MAKFPSDDVLRSSLCVLYLVPISCHAAQHDRALATSTPLSVIGSNQQGYIYARFGHLSFTRSSATYAFSHRSTHQQFTVSCWVLHHCVLASPSHQRNLNIHCPTGLSPLPAACSGVPPPQVEKTLTIAHQSAAYSSSSHPPRTCNCNSAHIPPS